MRYRHDTPFARLIQLILRRNDWYTDAAMNTETTMPLPVPMVKEATVKEDGRLLFYYTFPAETPQTILLEETAETMTEGRDV